MSLSASVVTYNCPAATGVDSITGLAFAPKAIKVTWTLLTANGSGEDFNFGRGFACNNGGTQQACWAGSSQNGGSAGSNNPRVTQSNAKVIYFADYTGTTRLSATVSAWNGDGITFNWATVTSGVDIQVTLYGGADISNVYIGVANASTATAPVTQSITAPNFQPDYVEIMLSNTASDEILGSVASYRGSIGLGTSAATHEEASISIQTASSQANSGQRTDTIAVIHAGSISRIGTLSVISTGFQINWSQTTAAANRFYYLCIKGGNWKVGSFDLSGSAGAQTVTGIGFTPSGVDFLSWGLPTSVTINTSSPSTYSSGTAISGAARSSIWAGINLNNRICSTNIDSTKILKFFTPNGATPTLLAAADLTSLTADTITINNTTVDGVSRQVLYTAYGSIPAALPTITQFAPTYGLSSQSIVITGTNLGGATAVTFNGTATTFIVDTANQITATVPVGATTGVINVTTPAGNVNSSNSFIIPSQTITNVVEGTTYNITWAYSVPDEALIDGFEIQVNDSSALGPWTTVGTVAANLRTVPYLVSLPSVYLQVIAYRASPLEESAPDEIIFLNTTAAPPEPPGPGEGGGGSGDVGTPPGMTILALPSIFTFGSIVLEAGKVVYLSNYVTSKVVNLITFCTHPSNTAGSIVYIGDQAMVSSTQAATTLKGPNQVYKMENRIGLNTVPLSNVSLTTDVTGTAVLISTQTS